MGFWLLRRPNRIQDDITSLESPLSKAESEGCKQSIHLGVTDRTEPCSIHKFKLKFYALDPGGKFIQRWNMLYLMATAVSLLVDPLFFLLPMVNPLQICIQLEPVLKTVILFLRSSLDVFYAACIFVRLRTAYVAPCSRAIGKGELVMDPRKIAIRYIRCGLLNDLMAALPLPQVLIWVMTVSHKSSVAANLRFYMLQIILVQMLHRFCLVYPLSIRLAKASGIITEKAWTATAYNLMFYLLACIVSGCWWYLLAVQRQLRCWKGVCDNESPVCVHRYLSCSSLGDSRRSTWLNSTDLMVECDPMNQLYQYGIFSFVVTENLSSGGFSNKFFYCLWWGIRNISSQGQNFITSIDALENIFAYAIGALGLILFVFFLGNMQMYLQTTNVSLEKWRVKQNDLEQWMHHRQLPKELKTTIRKYRKYKWIATRGVEEEAILSYLPISLQRQTKRYLCFNLVRRVPLFERLDERTLDAICERLKPALYTKEMQVICEGEQVTEMLFIIRGHLYSNTTDGSRGGFYNSSRIGPNDFCGEELLSWALERRQTETLPSSTRTVKAISDVEGFSLGAEDLKFICKQFQRRLRSKEFRHRMRFYSQQWRTWAACFIQAAWRRHRKRVNEGVVSSRIRYGEREVFVARPDGGIELYAAKLIADMRCSRSDRFGMDSVGSMSRPTMSIS